MCQSQNLNRCQSLSEYSRLHLPRRRLPRLAVERHWTEVAQRRAVAPGSAAGGGMPGCCSRNNLRSGTSRAQHPRTPHSACTCGVYAAKNLEHLRQFGYERRGIHGEVYLWGTVVEHKLGWRAQFAYPKSLFLPLAAIPFTLTEIDARLKTLIAFDTDIFILGEHESIRFWKNGSGFDGAGLDYLIKTRQEYYVRRQWERTLKKGDRVAVLGRGIAVVEQADDKEVA